MVEDEDYRRKAKIALVAIVLLASLAVFASFVAFAYYCYILVAEEGLKVFTFKQLHFATGGFSKSNVVGHGGFGLVYHGLLNDGRKVGIKLMDQAGKQGEEEFKVEVELLSRLHSPYLLALLGYCSDHNHKLLVYEFMPPMTFVVVQKRHHTRLFAGNHHDKSSVDRSGNILPGTVVDSKICHPTKFDFYLCSHAGIQDVPVLFQLRPCSITNHTAIIHVNRGPA
ncbi:hypothetical protein KIW84_013413 [Lathyrus oleraceus]|uniref:Protein kinase domain-containing protein n=1 Tax=Pisum sativum TaxID=3888 RepID=A0A9D5BKA7_PEA|nr:hypothetical protein KIW84_013413 [Pisum sativum]